MNVQTKLIKYWEEDDLEFAKVEFTPEDMWCSVVWFFKGWRRIQKGIVWRVKKSAEVWRDALDGQYLILDFSIGVSNAVDAHLVTKKYKIKETQEQAVPKGITESESVCEKCGTSYVICSEKHDCEFKCINCPHEPSGAIFPRFMSLCESCYAEERAK